VKPSFLAVPQFLIREATASDIAVLESLIEQSVRGLQTNDYSPEQIEGALGHALGLDRQLIADGTYFVAEVMDRSFIVGCGGWSNRKTLFGSDHGPNRQAEFLDPKREAAKLRAIFVHPDWARKGLGSLILGHCEERACAAGFVHLEMASTLTGIPVYLRRGYRQRETIHVSLPNGASLPVVRMTKSLAGASKVPTINKGGN
jgi:GNAT superfamily N-acetyltransferase